MNRFKKIVAVGMLLLLMVGVLAGCNADELRYWDQSVRLYKLSLESDSYSTGELRFNVDTKAMISSVDDKEELEKMMPLINLLERGSLKYEVGQSIKDDKQSIKIYGKAEPTAEYVPYFEVLRLNKINYIKIDPIRNFIQTYLADEEEAIKLIKAIPTDVAYIEISDESLVTELNSGSSLANPLGIDYTQKMMTMSDSEQVKSSEPFLQVVDNLLRKGYDGYSMDIIRQEGNTFKMTMKFNNLGEIISRLLNYTLDHSDQIQSAFFDGLRQVPATALATIVATEELTEADKNKAIDDMQVMAKEMLKDTSSIKEEMNASMEDMDKEINEMFGDSKMTVDMEILDTNNIRQSFDLMLDFKDPTSAETFKMNFMGTFFTKYNATLDIQKPESKTMTLKAIEALMPKAYTLYPADAYMTVDSGFGNNVEDLDIVIFDKSSYLYVEDLEQFTDAPSTVDEENSTLNVQTDKGMVKLPLYDDGYDYLFKIKDLEKLGFTVEWQSEDHSIRITK